MAQAHTGHLTGSDAVHDAVFAQFGVVRVDDLDEIIEISGMFCHAGLLAPGSAGGVAIYAMSGGTASHMVDLCAAAGLSVPRLEERTIDALGEYIPWFLRKDNPVDSGGAIAALPAGRAVLELMFDDANTDVLLAPITGVFPGMSDALAKDLIDLHRRGTKPVIAVWSSPLRDELGLPGPLRGGRPPVPLLRRRRTRHQGPGRLLRLRGVAVRSVQRDPGGEVGRGPGGGEAPGGGVDARRGRVQAAPGAPSASRRCTEVVATTSAEAVAAAAEIGLPGGHEGALGRHRPQVRPRPGRGRASTRWRRWRRRSTHLVASARRQCPEARVRGVVVQPVVAGAVAEAIIGLSQQAPFGPTILFGLGGIFTEVFEDVAFRVPPFTRESARAMVEEIKGATLLHGVRGRPAGDIEALVDVLMRFQRLAFEVGDQIDRAGRQPLAGAAGGAGGGGGRRPGAGSPAVGTS